MGNNRNASIIEDVDRNEIVVIHDILFMGKRSMKWDEVKEYLKKYVGQSYKIADSGDIVHIGNDLPNEYTGSEYRYSLRGAVVKAKIDIKKETSTPLGS